MKRQPSIVRLKQGRDKSARRLHPWIFSGSLEKVPDDVEPGDPVKVRDASGEFLANGFFNPKSPIPVRCFSWNADDNFDEQFLHERLDEAVSRRQELHDDPRTNAYRLVMSESDGLPGLIVDRYGDYLSVQVHSAGLERWRSQIVDFLHKRFEPVGIFEKSDDDARSREGMPRSRGVCKGEDPPDEGITIREDELTYRVRFRDSQKTGFYVDQRDNRALMRHFAKDADVLDVFSYTGGFSLQAVRAGARSVTAVDTAESALGGLRDNLAENDMPEDSVATESGGAFEVLRKFHSEGRSFDVIVVDPPKFAANASQVQQATRGYKDLALMAFKLLRPGGRLLTFSCSGHVTPDLFQKVLFGAALDAEATVQAERYLQQGFDHPVMLTFPESLYLKGWLCRMWSRKNS